MHVGIDSRLPFYRKGGISQYVRQLVRALVALDKHSRYTILQSRKERDSYVDGSAENFRVSRLFTPCHHRLERWSLGAELLRHRLDVLHSPDFIPPSFGARERVITVHDLNFLYFPEYLTEDSRRYYNDQIAWAVRVASHISADSHHTRSDLIERLEVHPDKVTTIHLAASPVYREERSREDVQSTLDEYNLPAGFVLFVGTLSPRKNVATLVDAYNELVREAILDVPLVLVGSKGWLYEEVFDTVARLGLQRQVRHLSGVSDVQLAHLYSAAGVLALPSYYEGFGLPVLEAMHCGCPVITSNRGSLPEIMGNAGIALEPDDVTGWAEAISEVIHDSERSLQMIKSGRMQAATFSWRATAEATLRIYRRAAGYEA